MNKLESQ